MQIHELNNYEGSLGAASFLAVDDGNDTGKLSTQKLLEATNANIESLEESLNARIDNIIAGGDAPSAAEVTDARLGANGYQYDSLGAAIRRQVSEIYGDIDVRNVAFAEVTGKYINNNSSEVSSAPFSHSTPIAVTAGEIIVFTATGYSDAVAMIATSNAAGTTFHMVTPSIDNTERVYTYTVQEDGYVVVSYDNRVSRSLMINGSASNERLNDRLSDIENSNVLLLADDADLSVIVNNANVVIDQTGKFINSSGVYSSSGAFNLSEVISLNKGEMLRFNAMGYLTNVSVLAKANDDSTYSPLIVSEDNLEHTFTFVANKDMNVVISTNKNVSPIYSVFSSRIDSNELRITDLEKDCFAFANMGVIGDSLAVGSSNYSDGVAQRPKYSWGKYIEREYGIETSLYSFGGATTRSWFTDPAGYAALQSGDVLDCYVIGLGVNDAYSLGAGYLGTIADINVGNEDANADTYYGNYSKIIAKIKAKSPRAKIFCLTNPKGTGAVSSTYNQAVRDIVDLYTNTYLLDLIDDEFYTSKEFTDTWNAAHSTALGYKLIAHNLYNNISVYIRDNLSEFLDIQWIAENHA